MNSIARIAAAGLAGALAAAGTGAFAGAHTWVANEIFSNADGTIQFVEIIEPGGAPAENGIGGAFITSATFPRSYDIPSNVAGSTANKTVLFGTPAFCTLFNQLPGSPTCDFIFPAGQVPFMSTSADHVKYSPYQATGIVYTAGQLPTDGVNSRSRTGTIGPNTPKNYAGNGGTIDASPPPAAVPDGTAGSTPMTATRLDAGGTSISVAFDTTTCAATTPDTQIIYGDRSNLPGSPGGAFTVAGSVCGVGTTSPYTWNSVPSAGDGSGLIWWVVVVKKGTVEGSWGDATAGERIGPGAGGSSSQCGVTSRSLSNACGH